MQETQGKNCHQKACHASHDHGSTPSSGCLELHKKLEPPAPTLNPSTSIAEKMPTHLEALKKSSATL